MRLLLHMVTKNEADRYLDSCLTHNVPFFDAVHVWDDQSTDDTREVAASHGVHVSLRPDGQASFMQSESAFREDGWMRMMNVLRPEPGDWIFTIDADEFLEGNPREAIEAALEVGYRTLRVKIPEIFLLDPLSQRVDGFWGTITGFRATEFREGDQRFRTGKMGCGTLPCYADKGFSSGKITLLHLGYAVKKDREEKYKRYSESMHENGHNPKHVMSVLSPPNLVLWDGLTPHIWRGKREETEDRVRR